MEHKLKDIYFLTWGEAEAKGVPRSLWLLAVKSRKFLAAASRVSNAAQSIVKTQILRKDRTTEEEYQARLATCDNCPGNHATYKGGNLYTCGPMIKSLIDANQKTCGCVLVKKARDLKENCPFGYWPTIKRT